MIDRRAIFLNAHAIARRTQGRQCIACSYRESFVIALRQCYANAKAAAERKARMDASAEAIRREAATIIRQRTLAQLREEIVDLERRDRLGSRGVAQLAALHSRYSALANAA